jgi:hypothetical protein
MSSNLNIRLIEVGYFLSRMSMDTPPVQLKAESWKDAYAKFFGTFGGDKTEEEFKNSLKNLRDHFDSHLSNDRTGWMGNDGNPQKLSTANQEVFDKLNKFNDNELWTYIRPLAVTTYSSRTAKKQNRSIKERGAKYFSSEFSGKKKVKAKIEGEATVNHGIVVDSLKLFVEKNFTYTLIFNTQKIDLAVEYESNITTLFEVKTFSDTQSIYTAVGQLLMHSVGLDNVTKFIVLPKNGESKDLVSCLTELNIKVIWFIINNDDCQFELSNKMEQVAKSVT